MLPETREFYENLVTPFNRQHSRKDIEREDKPRTTVAKDNNTEVPDTFCTKVCYRVLYRNSSIFSIAPTHLAQPKFNQNALGDAPASLTGSKTSISSQVVECTIEF